MTSVIALIVAASLLIGLLASIALIAHVPEPWFVGVFIVMLAAHFALTADRERAVRLFGALARMAGQRQALELARERDAYESGTAQAAE